MATVADSLPVKEGFEGLSPLTIFVAYEPRRGIGLEGGVPWPHIQADFSFMYRGTTFVDPKVAAADPEVKNVVIFGRRTYESFPEGVFPLKNRHNVLISSTIKNIDGAHVYPTLLEALKGVHANLKYHKIIIMGGVSLYEEALNTGLVEKIFVTRINKEYPADRFFPEIPDAYVVTGVSRTFSTEFTSFDYVLYEPKKLVSTHDVDLDFDALLLTGKSFKGLAPLYRACPGVRVRYHQEFQYLDILADVLSTGTLKENRTGIRAYTKFGYQMRFDLSQSFPLLTTKRVFLRGIAEELFWFIKGSTNGRDLLARNVRIWELNGVRSYLDGVGLYDREEHDLGPIYGFQWRHFGAHYTDMHADYKGQGVDQLINLIQTIKTNVNSRRLIVCSWNVVDLPKMALPPCHLLFQFFVVNGKLSCMMHQRSCDLGLGVPFNIASYSLLTAMIAQVCGLEPGEFIHNLADAHVYVNHVDQIKDQITRLPYPFPILKLNKDVKNIEDFKWEDIKVEGYRSFQYLAVIKDALMSASTLVPVEFGVENPTCGVLHAQRKCPSLLKMVKLARIAKKVLHAEPNTAKIAGSAALVESLASRGKSQPTIDFNNLPNLSDVSFHRKDAEFELKRRQKTKIAEASRLLKKTSTQSSAYREKIKEFVRQKTLDSQKVDSDVTYSVERSSGASNGPMNKLKEEKHKNDTSTLSDDIVVLDNVEITGGKASPHVKSRHTKGVHALKNPKDKIKNKAELLVKSGQKKRQDVDKRVKTFKGATNRETDSDSDDDESVKNLALQRQGAKNFTKILHSNMGQPSPFKSKDAAVLDSLDLLKQRLKLGGDPFNALGSNSAVRPSRKVAKASKSIDKASRGKRKRELKKEMWRRKHQFESEALKVVQEFRKQDKHGKALGNFASLHSQLDGIDTAPKQRPLPSKTSKKVRSRMLAVQRATFMTNVHL